MKARINYKSKKTIIIIAIAVVLLIAAITGTVAYIKGNNNAAAAMENTEVTEPANNGNDSNNNGGVENPNTPNTDNPEQIPIIDDNQNPTTPAQNGDTTTNPGTTTNQGTTTGTTTGNAGTTVPDTEYTQTTVVENPWKTEDITWAPISLQAITANNGLEICVPSFSIEKSSEIVKYSENKSDKAEVGDTIKYTITVTNTGKVTLNDIEVRDDMVGVSTTIKTLEVGRNEKILAEHVVSEEDIIKSLDNDGIITNIATAIYRNEEKETENTVEAKNEYNLTIKYIYEDGKQAAETYTETLIPKASYNVESPKIEGYKADKTVVQGEMPFSDVEETVVYTIDEDAKKELSYTVEYYKDGEIVSGDTQTVKTEVQVLQPDTLTVKKEDINTVNKYYGYKFEKTDPTTIPETVSNGDVIKVYYVIDEEAKKELSYTVEYYKDGKIVSGDTQTVKTEVQVLQPDILTVNKDTINTVNKYYGYKFEKTDPTTIPETVSNGDVIKVYYVIDEEAKKELSYTVEYYKDGEIVSGDTQTVKTEVQVLQPDTLTVKKEDINTVNKYYGYKFEKTDPATIPETVSNGDVIKVYYVLDEDAKKELSYTVEYYKDGEIVSGDTQTVKTEVQVLQPDILTVNKDTINTVNKYYGYKFEKTDPTTIPETVSNGDVIKVYYVIDEEAKKELSYTVEYYKDGEIVSGDTQTVKTEVQVLQPDTLTVNKDTINTVNKYEGYRFEKTDPTTIPETVSNGDVIKVYYVKRTDLTYTVHYYYNGIEAEEELVTVPGQKYLAEVSDVDHKAKYNGVIYEEYDRTTSNGTMPLIIGLGTNYINVYYGTPNVTINKEVNKSTANAGDILHYTITVTEDRGLVDAKNIKVTDNLPSELNVIQESITQDGKLNDAKTSIEWNVEKLGKGQNIKFEFDAKIKESSMGEVITNKATLNGNTDSNDAITTVNGKTVEVREITKGREADDVNIIFIMDNSSSMNEPIANTSYLNDDSYYVAPSDEQKTRLNSAKTATKEFINKIYADKNLKNTNMSVITFNNNESDQEDTADVIGKGPYTSDKVKEERHLFYTKYYVVENNERIYVEQATDGNYYEIKDTTIKSGANVVGSATSSNYSDLVTKVDGITIGCRREGFGTYINPALKQAKTIIEGYKNNEATKANRNIVIVLCDGDINGEYADSLNDLKKGDKNTADEIYCIGFGKDAANPKKNAYKTLANMTTVYEKDKSGKLVKKVYTAENTETLIQEFTSILENMNDKKNYITGVSDIVSDIKCGEIAIKASDILEMPLVVYNNDTEVINCASKEELANYGMSYDESNQIIRWDINECIEKNPNIDLSGTLKLRYYIPLN